MSDKLYGILIHPDTTIELVETPGGAEEIHRLVGVFFENVYLPDFPVSDIVMSVDEEGKLERVSEYNELDQVPFTYDEAQIMKEFCEMILKKIPKEDLDVVFIYVNNL